MEESDEKSVSIYKPKEDDYNSPEHEDECMDWDEEI